MIRHRRAGFAAADAISAAALTARGLESVVRLWENSPGVVQRGGTMPLISSFRPRLSIGARLRGRDDDHVFDAACH